MHGVGNLLEFEHLYILTKTFPTVALIVERDTSENLVRTVSPMTLSHKPTIDSIHHELHQVINPLTGKL